MRAPKKVAAAKNTIPPELEEKRQAALRLQVEALQGNASAADYNAAAVFINESLKDSGFGALKLAYINPMTMNLR